MKCPRCKTNMVKVSIDKHRYVYKCTKCNYVVGKTVDNTNTKYKKDIKEEEE